MSEMLPDTAAIRQFLKNRFSDEELTTLSFDYFREVYEEFSSGMSKGNKIQLLLDYCRRRDQMPALLAMLKRERPEQYRANFSTASRVEPPTTQSRVGRNPRQIFISHAHDDAEFAKRLANDLQERGWPIWIAPNSIRPGEKWVEAINRGLDESGIVVLVLTPEATKSRWVQSETSVAIELEHKGRMKFIPLGLKPAEVPALWRAYQLLSFRQGYANGLEDLLAELSKSTTSPIRSAEQLPTKISSPEPDEETHPSIALRLSVKPQAVVVGDEVKWTVTLRNDGDDDLQFVTVRRGRALLDEPFDLAKGKGRRFTFNTIYEEIGEKTEKVTATGIASDGTTVLEQASAFANVNQVRKNAQELKSVPAISTALPRASRSEDLDRVQGDRIVWEKDSKEMVRVPAGNFIYRGRRSSDRSKKEVHLPEFWIDKAPVTNTDYARFVAAVDYEPPKHWNGKTPPIKILDHPVVYVSWHDATAYANWAGKQLSTEEEWDKAARGTSGRRYPWGNERPTAKLCNFANKVGTTTPVGSYSPQGDSPFGCVDMYGNVWEWTDSLWADEQTVRIARGGGFNYLMRKYRAAWGYHIGRREPIVGFRLVAHLSDF